MCSVILQRLLVLKLVSSEKRTRPSVRGERNSLAPNIQPILFVTGKIPLTFTTYCIICTLLAGPSNGRGRSRGQLVLVFDFAHDFCQCNFNKRSSPTWEDLLGYSFSPILIAFLALTKCVASFSFQCARASPGDSTCHEHNA